MTTKFQISAQALPRPQAGAEAIACLAVSPAGLLVSASQSGAIRRVDLASGRVAYQGRLPAAAGSPTPGPALLVGEDGRYLLTNCSGGPAKPSLWVTDMQADRHWPIGPAALQMVASSDGIVWGVGQTEEIPPLPSSDPWYVPGQPPLGRLFGYTPGAEGVDEHPEAGPVSLAAEVPGQPGRLFLIHRGTLGLYDYRQRVELSDFILAGPPFAATVDSRRGVAWFTLPGGSLYGCTAQPDGEISVVIVGDHFGRAERGFFWLPRSGWLAGLAPDGTVSLFDPESQRVLHGAGPLPPAAGPAPHPSEDAWYCADGQITRCAPEGGMEQVQAVARGSQAEDSAGNLRLTLIHESMHTVLRLADDPGFLAEVMCPETVDPRTPDQPLARPRLDWDRAMAGVFWSRSADGWWELREDLADFGYLSRLRLNPDGRRLDIELTAFNRATHDLESVHFAPCVSLARGMIDLRHHRTYVVGSDGRLTLLGPLVDEHPYVAASVGQRPAQFKPVGSPAMRFADLKLGDGVIIVRARDGRRSLLNAYEQVDVVAAMFVPCIHSETYVERVPAGGAATVRGLVAVVPGDERAAYDYYREWRSGLV